MVSSRFPLMDFSGPSPTAVTVVSVLRGLIGLISTINEDGIGENTEHVCDLADTYWDLLTKEEQEENQDIARDLGYLD